MASLAIETPVQTGLSARSSENSPARYCTPIFAERQAREHSIKWNVKRRAELLGVANPRRSSAILDKAIPPFCIGSWQPNQNMPARNRITLVGKTMRVLEVLAECGGSTSL